MTLAADRNLHRELMRQAATPAGLAYHTSGLVFPGQTFGLEIEFCGGDREAVARDLHLLGLKADAAINSYHHSERRPGLWTMEHDYSVDVAGNGAEVISPPLTDSPETWAQIAKVCEVIQAHGGYVDYRAGSHVHVGVESSGMGEQPLQYIKNFMRLYAWSEDLLFRLSSASHGDRFHRGMLNEYYYSMPISESMLKRIDEANSLGAIREYIPEHYCLGMRYVDKSSGRRTVEVRINDGSLDPERCQANIMIACALMRAAVRLTRDEIPQRRHLLGTHDAKNRTDARLLRQFADLVLETEEQRLKAYSVYQRTDWQAGRAHAEHRVRERRRTAVRIETERARREAMRQGIVLSPFDRKWLHHFVDPNYRSEIGDTGIASEALITTLRWWIEQPLHRGAPGAAKWNEARVELGARLTHKEMVEGLLAEMQGTSGRAAIEIERRWLLEMTSLESSVSTVTPPTRAMGTTYEAWMQDGDTDNPSDVRSHPTLHKRWATYQAGATRRADRDWIIADVEATVGRQLSLEEEALVCRITQYRSIKLERLPDAGFLRGLVGALAVRSDTTHWDGRKRVREQLAPYILLQESVQEALSALQQNEHRAPTDEECSWFETVALACAHALTEVPLPAIPSGAAWDAFVAWKESVTPIASDLDWLSSLDGVAQHLEEQRFTQQYEKYLAAERQGVHMLFTEAHGRMGSDEAEWLSHIVEFESSDGEPPSARALAVAVQWLERELPPDVLRRDRWNKARSELRKSLEHKLAVRRLLDDAIDASPAKDALSRDDRKWLVKNSKYGNYDHVPSPAAGSVIETMKKMAHPGGYQIGIRFAEALRDSWHRFLGEIGQVYARELVSSYLALPSIAGRSARQREHDCEWLRAMTGASGLTGANAHPSSSAREHFVQWLEQPRVDFEGHLGSEVQNRFETKWFRWRYQRLERQETESLRAGLVAALVDPVTARIISGWFGPVMSREEHVPLLLPRAAKREIERWVESEPAGDPDVSAALKASRKREWSRIQAAQQKWELFGKSHGSILGRSKRNHDGRGLE